MEKKDLLKLLDICDTALFLLADNDIASLETFSHGEIDTMEALRFVDSILEKRNE